MGGQRVEVNVDVLQIEKEQPVAIPSLPPFSCVYSRCLTRYLDFLEICLQEFVE